MAAAPQVNARVMHRPVLNCTHVLFVQSAYHISQSVMLSECVRCARLTSVDIDVLIQGPARAPLAEHAMPAEPVGDAMQPPRRQGPLRRAAARAIRCFRRLTQSPVAGANGAEDAEYVPLAQELALTPDEATHRRNALPQLCIARRLDFLESDVKGANVTEQPEHPHARRHNVGAMDSICQHCNAKLWGAEVAKGPGTTSSLCCIKGKVKLPVRAAPPQPLRALLEQTHRKAKTFMSNIRSYNSAFQLASSAIAVDRSVTAHGGPASLRINGSVHHSIGPLHPTAGEPPRFAQLYVYDNANELQNRLQAFPGAQNLDAELMQELQTMLHEHNALVRTFKAAASDLTPEGKIVFHCDNGQDRRRYNVPSSSEVAAVMPADGDVHPRDIVVHYQHERPCWRINELHPMYMPLHFLLLFPYGEQGWTLNIPHANIQQPDEVIGVEVGVALQEQVRAEDRAAQQVLQPIEEHRDQQAEQLPLPAAAAVPAQPNDLHLLAVPAAPENGPGNDGIDADASDGDDMDDPIGDEAIDEDGPVDINPRTTTLRQYAAYELQVRQGENAYLQRANRLFQVCCVYVVGSSMISMILI